MDALCCSGRSSNVVAHYQRVKWVYCIGFLITIVITWFLRDYGDEVLANNLGSFSYCQDKPVQSLCSGKEAALRISFGNFIFFAVHLLLLLGVTSDEDPRACLHTGLWCFKVLAWGGVVTAMFFVPSSVLRVYGEIARVGSGFFLVLQVIELIQFVYLINEYLLGVDKTWSIVTMVVTSILTICLGIIMHGYAYHFFAPSQSCRLELFFITWSLLMLSVMVGILFIPSRAESAGLLTTATVFAYTSYLLLSALNSAPHSRCSTLTQGTGVLQVVAFFLALATIAYGTLSTGTANLLGSSNSSGELPYRADMFHLAFALASMYIAMLFTNWELSSSSTRFQIDRGMKSTWIKMASKWFCELLYAWTVVAPALMPDRDFS